MIRSQAVALVDAGSRELDNYDPSRGLDTIAIAEAAEKRYAKAKNSDGLHEAVQHKLGEQRRFVLWWDSQGKHKGGNPTVTGLQRLEDLGTNRETVHRWRKKLADPRKFDEALESASQRCVQICEAQQGQTAQRGASGTGENEWYTPEQYLKAARDVLGDIDLDPASSKAAQEKVRAARFIGEKENGLDQEWHGRVWLNPPYAQPYIAEFVSKMVAERRAGRVSAAIMLTHNYTDTSWFHEGASIADAICFTRGRIKFYDAKGNTAAPTQGQAFFYYGSEIDIFADVFGEIGFVVEVRK